jgi:hypothetical protein
MNVANLVFEELQAGEKLVRVNQDTRLNNRVLDLRTPANQGIFHIACQVETVNSSSLLVLNWHFIIWTFILFYCLVFVEVLYVPIKAITFWFVVLSFKMVFKIVFVLSFKEIP